MDWEKNKYTHADVVIVVPVKNESKYIQECVDSLIIAARGKAEIVIIDDGSNDDTCKILSIFGDRISLIQTRGIGPSACRNLVIDHTDKPLVAFTDGDCVVDAFWLDSLLAVLESEKYDCVGVGGLQSISLKASWNEKWNGQILEALSFVSDYLHHEGEIRRVHHNPTCNSLYETEALRRVGGFDEKLWPCEDLDLDMKISKDGGKLYVTPYAKVVHRRPETFISFCKMMSRYGKAHGKLAKKHKTLQMTGWISIFLFLPTLGLCLAGLGFQIFLFWLVSVIALSMLFVIRRRKVVFFLAGPYFLVPFFLWNLQFYRSILTRS
ncbi:MAG: glycosyltransferase [Bdellovibrionales bacterium]|nr:glycosyltransferase [Bdellovibrionales bacterium]